MYKLFKSQVTDQIISVCRENQNNSITSFSFAPESTDYQQFKKDIQNGVELMDSTGTVMTQEQITTFLSTLP